MNADIKSPIEELKEFQLGAGCNNERFLWWIENRFIPADPTCHVRQKVKRIVEEQGHDPYKSRIWILYEFRGAGLIDVLGAVEDAVFWYEKYKEAVK